MRTASLTLILLAAAGCATATQGTLLKHPTTGAYRECKGADSSALLLGGAIAAAAASNARDECVRKAEAEGYQRIFGPAAYDEAATIPPQR